MGKNYKIIWLLILFFLSFIIGVLLFSENILLYLSPRMIPIVYFGFIVLLILFFYQLRELFFEKANNENTFSLNYLLFFVPIFLFFTSTPDADIINELPNQSIDISYGAETIEAREQPVQENESEENIPIPEEITTEENEYNENTSMPEETSIKAEDLLTEIKMDVEDMPPCILTEGIRQDASADQFKECLYFELEEIIGNEVTMYGFIFKYESLPEDTILIARQIVSCCVADAVVGGFPVKVINADDFIEGEWIEVSGTVNSVELLSYDIYYEYPIIIDGTIIMCDEPPLDETYIYP